MSKTRLLLALGLCSAFNAPAFANSSDPQECSDAPPPYKVTVTVDASDHSKPPVVEPDTVCASFGDEIEYTANVEKFFVTFTRYSPFMGNLNGSKGKAKAKVKVKAHKNKQENEYNYTVRVPGYPPADPWIQIR